MLLSYKETIAEYLENNVVNPRFYDCVNYAIFVIGATHNENFNADENREHLFNLRALVDFLIALEKNINTQTQVNPNGSLQTHRW